MVIRMNFSNKLLQDMLIEWIAIKYLPFSFFEDDSTIKLFKYLNPECALPNGDVLRNSIVEYSTALKSAVKTILGNVKSKVSFTVDGWTDGSNETFYGITAHFISDKWEMQSVLIDFVRSWGENTGKAIARVLFDAVEKCGLVNKIEGITIDKATANTGFKDELSNLLGESDDVNKYFRCFVDIINQSVQDTLCFLKKGYFHPNHDERDDLSDDNTDSEDDNNMALSKFCNMFKKIKESETLLNEFHSICQMTREKELEAVVGDKNSWTSLDHVFSVALKVKTALNVLCERKSEMKSFAVSESEWELVTKMHQFLKDFKHFLALMNGEVSLPMVVVGFNMLLHKVEESMVELEDNNYRTTVDESLLFSFHAARDRMLKFYAKSNWIYFAVLLLDPRHNRETFRKTEWGSDLLENCIGKFEEVFKTEYYKPKTPMLTDPSETAASDDEDCLDFTGLYSKPCEPSSVNNSLQDWQFELDDYYKMQRAKSNENILFWWLKHEHHFPNLSAMARDLLSIQAKSVPSESERLFSHSTQVICDNKLTPRDTSTECLMCVNSWITCSLANEIKQLAGK